VHREQPDWVPTLEQAPREEQMTILSFLAGREVGVDEQELNGAIRRAQLLQASGGDPRRPPELEGRAVTAVAADLDTPERRAALRAGLERLAPLLAGHAGSSQALQLLLEDSELAWHAYALGLLADAVSDADD
jgi:hypothetical protein